MASMPVKNGKKGAFWPPIAFFLRRLLHVQHYRHSVFVVVANNALVGICCVGLDNAVLFDRVLGRLEVGQLDMRQLQRLGRA